MIKLNVNKIPRSTLVVLVVVLVSMSIFYMGTSLIFEKVEAGGAPNDGEDGMPTPATIAWSNAFVANCPNQGPRGWNQGDGWNTPTGVVTDTNGCYTACTYSLDGDFCGLVCPPPPPPPALVNAVCSATHYQCAAGSPVNNTENQNSWTWSCNGSGGGANSGTCSEMKPVALLPMTYAWSLVSNPVGSAPSIVNGTSLTPTFNNLLATGIYTFRLTATDGYGVASFDDVSVSVVNDAPVVFAGFDQTIEVFEDATSPVNAFVSDPEGGAVTTAWTNTVRPTGARAPEIRQGTTLTPTFSGLNTIGTYTFRLTGTDNASQSTSDTMDVVVTANSCATPPCTPPPVASSPRGTLWARTGVGVETEDFLGITLNDSAELTWTTSNAVSCLISDNISGGTGDVVPTNNRINDGTADRSVTPLVPTRYSLSCYASNNALYLIDSILVDPSGVTAPEVTGEPRVVTEGDPATLRWNLNGQVGCTLSGGEGTVYDQTFLEANNKVDVIVTARTVYTLQCPSGTDTVMIEILPRQFES